jgi:hypothetical protein
MSTNLVAICQTLKSADYCPDCYAKCETKWSSIWTAIGCAFVVTYMYSNLAANRSAFLVA